MKKAIYLLLTTTLIVQWTYSQSEFTPLAIGDKLPDLVFENTLYNGDREIRLSDYRGQLLILDFWATWCSPCIASFPKLDSLEKSFGDKLTILPVTYQDKQEVEKLFSRMAKLKDIQKPMIYGDNILRTLFQHNSLPYYIWIDQGGTVVALTSSDEINTRNIELSIAGDFNGINSVQQQESQFDQNIPLRDQIGKDIPPVYQSTLWGYVPGFPSMASAGSFFSQDEKTIRIFFTNVHLMHLYRYAYRNGNTAINIKNVDVRTERKGPFEETKTHSNTQTKAWMEDGNVFTYELEVDRIHKDKVWEIFKADLQTFFPQYNARVEKKSVPALALVAKENCDLKTKGGEPSHEFTVYGAKIQNRSLNYLISYLNLKFLQQDERMVINQTGIIEPVDIQLECNMTNLDEIKKALSYYGLDLIETEAEQEILLITDRY
ncbi:TlpA family protein disulfide reductase [Fontibacter flavus]|uniref:TlpA family protein disulfide reductase n=1 Tax=Fontibacter flavus TaxID=654838 RepID=A0ABV6FZU7_9BACT